MKSTQHTTRFTALAAAITTALYAGNAAAIQRAIHTGPTSSNSDNFTMLAGNGGVVDGTNDVLTAWDGTVFTAESDYTGAGSTANITASSTTAFFGYTWTAHDIQVFAPGTYSFNTASPAGNPESGTLTATVPANSLGMHMLFDWNGNLNIDVFIVVSPSSLFGTGIASNTSSLNSKCSSSFTGTIKKNCLYDGARYGSAGQPLGTKVWMLASTDPDGDGVMGVLMTAGGPFGGFNANFNFAGNILTGGLAPLVIDDLATSINAGGSGSVTILGNDVDIDNTNSGTITAAQLFGGVANSSSITIANQTGGTATVNADGTVTWTNSGATGTDSFTYTLKDLTGNVSAQATVTIPVITGNAPVANPDTLPATEDTDLTITKATDLIGNDTDAESATNLLTIDSFTQPPTGMGTITDGGTTLLYTPPADFSGAATFTYTIIDPSSAVSNSATVTINVAAVNDNPVAQNDSATASFETPSTVTVLGNDTDVDTGDTLTVTGTSTPASGSTQINSSTTITYTPNTGFSGSDSFTYDISDGNGGTDTATVSVTVLGAAAYVGTAVPNTTTSSEITGGSNFTMLDGTGADVGGTNDISASWDGTLKTDVSDTVTNMLLASDLPTPFFGFTWDAHDVRVFGPGSYTFDACPGGDGSTRCTTSPQSLTMTVGPTQVGMHMLFDWGQPGASTPCGLANCNIDVVQVVELNKAFAGATDGSNVLGAAGAAFTMASIDGNDDGNPGIPMVDGAFVGFNANFNLNLTPQFALPVVTAVASQGGNPTSVIVPTGGSVTITATAPAGATFDWDSTLISQQTDAALVAVNTNGLTSQTFVFDPSTLTDGPVTARVTIRDPNNGDLANYSVVPMVVSASTLLADAADANSNGIPDGQDSGLPATQIPAVAGDGTNYLVQTDAGTLHLGQIAADVGAASGSYAVGLTATNIGVTDTAISTATCAGGCFDYEVTGLNSGASINVVLPLSAAIPADAAVRKFANGEWRNFSLLDGDALASAPGSAGTCPAPGNVAYVDGLNEGDFCIQVTITDGGRNDADGTANGTIRDPIGLGVIPTTGGTVSNIGDPPTGGGGATGWLTLAGLLGWLGLSRRRSIR